ncbi:MAG: hypothetical protein E4H05_01000 [Acidimicrobiales bacterium]|nr:MAG: hypothetical protein E4H05_01000 [Acidimicrobiales bacterium]
MPAAQTDIVPDDATKASSGRGVSADAVVWIVTVVAVVVFWLVATSWRPWALFDRAGFGADFYDEQARAFWHGRLAVDPAIPGPEGFVIGGRTYLYYGPFLSLVRMPLMLFGDLFVGRLVRVSMLIAVVVLCRWSARLARAGRAVIRSSMPSNPVDERWALGLFTAAVAFSPALFAAGWISVYNETELWALTLAVIGLALIAEWAASGFVDRRLLLGASAAALAATLTRAPIGLGVSLALVASGGVLLWRSRRTGFDRGRWALLGGVLPIVAHVAVNFAKFGTLFSVPGDRQLLSLTDPVRAAWFAGNNGSFFSYRFLPTTLVQYLRPDGIRFERLVPGIRFGPLAVDRGSYPAESITPASSLPTSATLLLVLGLIGVVWLLLRRNRTWLLLVVASLAGAVPTFMIGFVANRYLIDMLPPLIVAGAIGIWVILAVPRRRVVKTVGVVLAVWGLWVNASLATWTNEYKTLGFTQLRYDIDDALFGAPSPSLVSLVAGVGVPRDGIVALDPQCQGVYMAEQGHWLAIDRGGTRRATGTIEQLDGAVVLAAGSGWVLELVESDGVTMLRVLDSAGSMTFEQSVDATTPTDYEVVLDNVTREFWARVGAAVVFLPVELSAMQPATADGAPSALCVDLSRQL